MAKYVFVEFENLTDSFTVDYKPSLTNFEIMEYIDNFGFEPEIYSVPVVKFPSGIQVESCNPDKLSFSALNTHLISELNDHNVKYEIY